MTEYERRVELSIDHIFRLQGRPYEPHQSKAVDDIRDAVLIGMTGKSPHDAVADRTLSTTSGEEAVEVVPGRQLPWFASERQEKRGLK